MCKLNGFKAGLGFLQAPFCCIENLTLGLGAVVCLLYCFIYPIFKATGTDQHQLKGEVLSMGQHQEQGLQGNGKFTAGTVSFILFCWPFPHTKIHRIHSKMHDIIQDAVVFEVLELKFLICSWKGPNTGLTVGGAWGTC